jgi:DUF438 domain-containing protein
MSITRTIDVKGLGHTEKENLIFPGIEALAEGNTLRIIFDFNPLPLVYILKTRSEFEIVYEKEGPKEWILNITKIISEDDTKEQLKELIRQLKDDKVSAEVKEKAKNLLQTVDAKTLGILEQELVLEGISHEEIRKDLCDIHLEIIKDKLVTEKIEVQPPHPAHTFMEEHIVILNSLNELSDIVKKLRSITSFKGMGPYLEKLEEISHHLLEAESHHQREEEGLFPKLEKHDITEPPEIMRMDHVEFRKRKQELGEVTHNHRDYDFAEFKRKVIELGEYLAKELENHIFKEDNIIYQIALQILSPEEWEKVKKDCDKIGYCCFTPEDQNTEK